MVNSSIKRGRRTGHKKRNVSSRKKVPRNKGRYNKLPKKSYRKKVTRKKASHKKHIKSSYRKKKIYYGGTTVGAQDPPLPLPAGWIEEVDRRPGFATYGQTYYFNTETDNAQWERPAHPPPDTTRMRRFKTTRSKYIWVGINPENGSELIWEEDRGAADVAPDLRRGSTQKHNCVISGFMANQEGANGWGEFVFYCRGRGRSGFLTVGRRAGAITLQMLPPPPARPHHVGSDYDTWYNYLKENLTDLSQPGGPVAAGTVRREDQHEDTRLQGWVEAGCAQLNQMNESDNHNVMHGVIDDIDQKYRDILHEGGELQVFGGWDQMLHEEVETIRRDGGGPVTAGEKPG